MMGTSPFPSQGRCRTMGQSKGHSVSRNCMLEVAEPPIRDVQEQTSHDHGEGRNGTRLVTAKHSHVRVFGKSLHLLAAGWMVSVGWIWLAEIRQFVRRHDATPPDLAVTTLLTGAMSAVVLEVLAYLFVRWTGSASTPGLQRREWHHAFWWAAFPNLMLLYTVYILIFGID
jgi:hypothetical protein